MVRENIKAQLDLTKDFFRAAIVAQTALSAVSQVGDLHGVDEHERSRSSLPSDLVRLAVSPTGSRQWQAASLRYGRQGCLRYLQALRPTSRLRFPAGSRMITINGEKKSRGHWQR
jgi:hypothetical protein